MYFYFVKDYKTRPVTAANFETLKSRKGSDVKKKNLEKLTSKEICFTSILFRQHKAKGYFLGPLPSMCHTLSDYI